MQNQTPIELNGGLHEILNYRIIVEFCKNYRYTAIKLMYKYCPRSIFYQKLYVTVTVAEYRPFFIQITEIPSKNLQIPPYCTLQLTKSHENYATSFPRPLSASSEHTTSETENIYNQFISGTDQNFSRSLVIFIIRTQIRSCRRNSYKIQLEEKIDH